MLVLAMFWDEPRRESSDLRRDEQRMARRGRRRLASRGDHRAIPVMVLRASLGRLQRRKKRGDKPAAEAARRAISRIDLRFQPGDRAARHLLAWTDRPCSARPQRAPSSRCRRLDRRMGVPLVHVAAELSRPTSSAPHRRNAPAFLSPQRRRSASRFQPPSLLARHPARLIGNLELLAAGVTDRDAVLALDRRAADARRRQMSKPRFCSIRRDFVEAGPLANPSDAGQNNRCAGRRSAGRCRMGGLN